MTSGEPPAGPNKAKVAGYGLIGVGVIAAVIGVSGLGAERQPEAAQEVPPAPSGHEEPDSADPGAPQPGSTEPGAQQPGVDRPGGEVPGEGSDPQPPPGPQVPPRSEPGGAVVDPPPAPNRDPQRGETTADRQDRVVVRVYNNSKIKGLAHRAAEDFRAAGYEVPEVGNYARGVVPTTTVYFRPGTGERAAAEEAAEHFDARVRPRFEGIDDSSPGLIAIITNDYRGAGS